MKISCSSLGKWGCRPVAIPPHLAHCEGRFAASPFPEGGDSREFVECLFLADETTEQNWRRC
jgi:hypothetical protein